MKKYFVYQRFFNDQEISKLNGNYNPISGA